MTGYITKITLGDKTAQYTAEVFIEEGLVSKALSCFYTYELQSISAVKANMKREDIKMPIIDESTFGYYVRVIPKQFAEPRFMTEEEYEMTVDKLRIDNEVEKVSCNTINCVVSDILDAWWKVQEAAL